MSGLIKRVFLAFKLIIEFRRMKDKKTTIAGILTLIVSVLLGIGKIDQIQAEGLKALFEPLMGVLASFGLFAAKDSEK